MWCLKHLKNRQKIWISVVALGVAVSGCSTNRATGDQSFTAFMSEEQELKVGAEEHPKILKAFGGKYENPVLEAYVHNIGRALADVSEVPNLPYSFTILNDHKVNAFALPGGYVYITRGLLALAENEAEMAGVLAHEIGHITARHSAERHSTAMATNIGLTVLGVIGSAVGVPSGVGQAVSMGAQAAIQSYSREQELEADMLGVRYMTRLGYSPDGLTTFFKKMSAHSELEARSMGQDGIQHNIMSTHPRTEQRIDQAIHLSKSQKVDQPIQGRETYLSKIDGMTFGDDPAQGIRKGREFIHPELRFRFTVPPGFSMINAPDKLQAFGPNNAKIIFDMANPENVAKFRNLESYLQHHWANNTNVRNIERLEINEMPAVTGTARVNTSVGPRDIRFLIIKGDEKHLFRMVFITDPADTDALSTELRRTTYSFRRLSLVEARTVLPLKIKTVQVKKGDTIDKMAARIPIETYGPEWFRLINSLQPGDPLVPGQTVKTIVE